jgi:peptidyl-prolyl cis-trans isomerase C
MFKANKKLMMAILILSLAGLTACGGGKKLVSMKGGDISLGSFEKELMKASENPYYQGFLSTAGGKKQYMEGLIEEKVLIYQSRKEGLDRKKEYKERIQSMKDQILIGMMMEELKQKYLNVSEQEINDYYEKQKDEFVNPEQVRASHILVTSRKEAEDVMSRLSRGESFETLARQYSIDSITAAKGGDLGIFKKGDMVPAFEQAVFGLKKTGDVSGIIETQFGFHIIKLTDRQKLQEKNIDDARNEIMKLLQKNKYEKLMVQYKHDMRINVNYSLLDKISVPVQQAGAENRSQNEGGIK